MRNLGLDPYRAKIGRHKAVESVFAPKASDERLRRFCEAWQALALEIEADSRHFFAADVSKPLTFCWRGTSYALSEGDAAAVCDAYALASIESQPQAGDEWDRVRDRWRQVDATLRGIQKRNERLASADAN